MSNQYNQGNTKKPKQINNQKQNPKQKYLRSSSARVTLGSVFQQATWFHWPGRYGRSSLLSAGKLFDIVGSFLFSILVLFSLSDVASS